MIAKIQKLVQQLQDVHEELKAAREAMAENPPSFTGNQEARMLTEIGYVHVLAQWIDHEATAARDLTYDRAEKNLGVSDHDLMSASEKKHEDNPNPYISALGEEVVTENALGEFEALMKHLGL